MIKNTIQLMNESKTIAQSLAPFDTGNLRYNAIRAYKTPTGFRIVTLYTAAFYGVILDNFREIRKSPNKHYGWWTNGVTTAVGSYINAVLNNKQSNAEVPTEQVAKFAADNPERRKRFYNSMVADEGREKYLSRL